MAFPSSLLRWTLAVVGGGAACIWLDYLHATHGVTGYFRADLGVQPWWVLLLFPTAVLVTVATVEPTRRLLGGSQLPLPTLGQLVADFGLFVGAYALTSFLHDRPTLLALILVGGWLGRCLGRQPLWVILFSLGNGVAGFAAEASLIALGQFKYQHPDLFGVARWLPGIYLHAGLLGVTLSSLVRAPKPTAAAS